MQVFYYIGKVRNGANKENLKYESNGVVENGLVRVVHIQSGAEQFYTQTEFHRLFKVTY